MTTSYENARTMGRASGEVIYAAIKLEVRVNSITELLAEDGVSEHLFGMRLESLRDAMAEIAADLRGVSDELMGRPSS